ncbi:MAG: hypothetical protein WCJ40_10675, partial [Planctomycetota bacterium]
HPFQHHPPAARNQSARRVHSLRHASTHLCMIAGIHKRRRTHPQHLAEGIRLRLFGEWPGLAAG